MTIDDIAARHAAQTYPETSEAEEIHHDRGALLAEIVRLTAALADAEARGRLAGLRRALLVIEEAQAASQIDRIAAFVLVGMIGRALAQSPEDGKQEKV